MVGATAVIALEAEMVSGAVTRTADTLGLSPAFLGVIVLALVGTSADLFAASWFAYRDKIGLALNICVGSAIQVALVVAPLLVLISAFMDRPMPHSEKLPRRRRHRCLAWWGQAAGMVRAGYYRRYAARSRILDRVGYRYLSKDRP